MTILSKTNFSGTYLAVAGAMGNRPTFEPAIASVINSAILAE